jgi:hypothetical protein
MSEDRIAALERRIADLEARLGAAEGPARATVSMRKHSRCPICDHRSLLRIFKVADRAGTAVAAMGPVVDERGWISKSYGQFVIYVCRQCGFAEWYVGNVGEIPADVPGVEAIEGPKVPPGDGPFR